MTIAAEVNHEFGHREPYRRNMVTIGRRSLSHTVVESDAMSSDAMTLVTDPTRAGAMPEVDYFATHYGLAVSLARRYSSRGMSEGSFDDLKQVSLLGLIHAVKRFDTERGVPFTAFATTTIIGELKHYLRDHSWVVRPPRRIQDLFLHSREAIAELTQELGRPPTLAEVGRRVNASAGDVEEALEAGGLRRLASLDAASGEHEYPLVECVQVVDRGMNSVEDRLALRWLLSRLPERERRIIWFHYIDGMTQHEIAEQMSISQAHVQRLLVRSLDHMRALSQAS